MDLGYNIAWLPPVPAKDNPLLTGSYGRDLITHDGRFSRACFAAQLTKAAGGDVMRVWLCEGEDKEGIQWDGIAPTGLSQELLDGVDDVMSAARLAGVKVLWTLLTANIDPKSFRGAFALPENEEEKRAEFESRRAADRNLPLFYQRHRRLLCDGNLLKDKVVKPFLQRITDRNWKSQVYGVDIANEASVLADSHPWNWLYRLYGVSSTDGQSNEGWTTLTRVLVPSFREIQLAGIPVTASIAWKDYWDNDLNPAALGAIKRAHDQAAVPQHLRLYDVHLYNNTGSIPSSLGTYKQNLIIGECGTKWDPVKDDYREGVPAATRAAFVTGVGYGGTCGGESFYPMLQCLVLHAFAMNASQFPVKALLPWRLLDWPRSGDASRDASRWRSRNRPKTLVGVMPWDQAPRHWPSGTQSRLIARQALVRLVHLKERGFMTHGTGSLDVLTQLLAATTPPEREWLNVLGIDLSKAVGPLLDMISSPSGFNARSAWQALLTKSRAEAASEVELNRRLNEALTESLSPWSE